MTTPKPFAPPKTGWSSLERPHFSPGLLLEDEDLNLGVTYTRELMRLMVRSLFGCGVVCGLKVTAVPTCHNEKRRIDVSRGVAFNCFGDIIEVTAPWSYEFGRECEGDFPGQVWVVLCYREKCCRPKDAGCSADEKSQSAHTRVRAGYEIKLCTALPKCACRCGKGPELPASPPASWDDCCGGSADAVAVEDPQDEEDKKDPCRCYTDHFNGVCDCECGCDCVVLGVVDPALVTEDENGAALDPAIVQVYDQMVRRVRPVLNGHVQCLFGEQALTDVIAPQAAYVKRNAQAATIRQKAPGSKTGKKS